MRMLENAGILHGWEEFITDSEPIEERKNEVKDDNTSE